MEQRLEGQTCNAEGDRKSFQGSDGIGVQRICGGRRAVLMAEECHPVIAVLTCGQLEVPFTPSANRCSLPFTRTLWRALMPLTTESTAMTLISPQSMPTTLIFRPGWDASIPGKQA